MAHRPSPIIDSPHSASFVQPPDGFIPSRHVDAKLIIIMVGLPARGKSYIVKKLGRYLNWLQLNTGVFNVGERRRKASSSLPVAGRLELEPTPDLLSAASFFNPSDATLVSLRDQLALQTLDELLHWLLNSDGRIGILDATNSTVSRRQLLLSHIQQRSGSETEVLFLESCCSDADILEKNIKLKLVGPDYAGKDPERSLMDFRRRIAHYEKSYVPIGRNEEDQRLPYVQMIDVGRKINTHLIRGYIQSRVVEYLLNFNLSQRQVWLSCNGQSIDDSAGRIGRNSDLSAQGTQFARALVTFINQQRQHWESQRGNHSRGSKSPFSIWTSMMPQAIQTAGEFSDSEYTKTQVRMLNDMNAGNMAGLTFDEIAARYPEEFASRSRDKLLYRWPGIGGEGYVDIINRLRSVIVELERTSDNLLLITHRAVVRVLLAYFMDLRKDNLADLSLPKGSVFCFEMVRLDTRKLAPLRLTLFTQ
ncbi:Uncharacterized protein TPAR_02975 [Tolypocladium paradoxum]|uniref:6-phosphofructo-2-kinase domain-containing protein n=1 Tax=Tolypocladium paradoxum TaxID=94208 RepID=A0A2S4L336_9HYPO|nr:Uncharacterized protein TPAR_02975 [Tolypocladium paradoxum]